LSKTDVAAAGDAILKMSSEVGKGPQDLAEGLYFIASAGFDAKDSMQILEVSAKAAAVGMTDTQTVANALTAALKAFPGMSVADAVDMMSKTVATGKTEWADYAGVVGEVSLAASQSGTRFVEANAAFAVLTNTMKSSEAATALKGLMEASSHVSDLTDRAKSLGLTFDANTYKSQTFLGRLQYLQTATDGNSESMKKLLGTDEAMAAISGLLTGGAQDYSKALDSIAESTGTAKSQFDTTSASAQAAWDRATASVQALQVKVGTALLPIITTFSDKIAPMVTRMLDWAEKNHVIENAINDLSSALSFIVTTGSNVIAFFQNNKAALIALGVVAVAVAGAITAAFIIWGISAAAAAIAQLGLIWPWLLLGAVVALVIAGVILAVLHWGDIVNWLSGVWGAFSGWFMGLLGGIGAFFTGLWTGIANFFTGLWAGIITGLQTAWNFIVSIVVAGAQFLLAAFMAPFVAIGAAFIWLYNHNIYFKALIDGIVSQVTTGLTWVSTQWQNFVAWLGMLWQGLVGFAANLWGQISGAIHDGFFAAIGFIVGVWTTISTVFSNAWSTYVSGPLTAMWTAVSTFFSGIWANYIAGPIGDLWNSISGAIGGWITSAIEWGGNLIQGFVNGIVAKAGNVASAVGGIAGQVLAFLGFHSPTKEGPGRFADQWAPAFVDMFASGIEQGVPRMEKALGNFIKPMAFDIKASTNAIGSSAPAAFATAPAMSASPVSATPVSATPTANNNSAPVYIVVHVEPPSVTLDKRELVDQVGEGVTRTLIRRTGVR
jgi:TP901 family phage tail tape measure protein